MADLKIDSAELSPLVTAVVTQTIAELDKASSLLNGRLAIDENEGARLLGLHSWQLRDLRLAGKIGYCRIVGNKVRYTRDDLLTYLRERHEDSVMASRKPIHRA